MKTDEELSRDALNRLKRGRLTLLETNPFFSYLSMHLTFIEENSALTKGTMAIDCNGNMYFNRKFVLSMSEREVVGVICHEILHVVFDTFGRKGSRNHELFNIATDISNNDLLVINGFSIPIIAIIPHNHSITAFGKKIVDIDKKTAEEIYNELYKQAKAAGACFCGGKCGGDKECGTFDSPIYDGKIEGKAKDWKKVLVNAAQIARNRGNIPEGMERILGEILYPKIDWRQMLYKYITREIPHSWTYSRPSKRSVASGFYLPSVMKKNIDIVTIIDTSGSIEQQELTDFMSEIIGITRAFDGLKMTCIVCDAAVSDVIEVSNGNIDDLYNLKIKGGGGTDVTPAIIRMQEEVPNAKLWIYFTDGETMLSIPNPVKSLWVLCKGGTDKYAKTLDDVETVFLD